MNDQPERPKGQRFSHVYIDRSMNVADSARIRRRVTMLFFQVGANDIGDIGSYLTAETGEPIPIYSGYDWHGYFSDCPLDTFLDSLTLIFARLSRASQHSAAKNWQE